MSWFLSILIALLTGVAAAVCAGLVAARYANWYRVSNFEGAAGYIIVGVGLLGAIAGFVLGLVVARYVAGSDAPGFLRALSIAIGSVLGIAAVAAGGGWLLAEHPPLLDGNPLMLEVELRLPLGATLDHEVRNDDFLALDVVQDGARQSSQQGSMPVKDARREGERWIVPGSAYLHSQRGRRAIRMRVNGIDYPGFLLPLPPQPGREHLEWSEWGPRPPEGSPHWPESQASYRFRVSPILPPPPAPTESEAKAAAAAEEERKFAALGPDTPLPDWMPFLRPGAPEVRVQAALRQLRARANLMAEIAELVQGGSPERASEAFYLVTLLTPPPRELVAPVQEYGRGLVARLREIVAMPVDQDPGYHQVADFSVRFSAWRAAAHHLRAAGGDFAPELQAVLELSRRRDDSLVLRGDVRRIASYWLQQWNGTPPHPDDPPPR